MIRRNKTVVVTMLLTLFLFYFPLTLKAHPRSVVFWNKMEVLSSGKLVSEIGSDLSLNGTNWSFNPAKFGYGWDNHSENSYAYANSRDLIEYIKEGAVEFWWVPDDDANETPFAFSVFFSNGATNFPANDKYQFEFWYDHSKQSFLVSINKRDALGNNHNVVNNQVSNPLPGNWLTGDKVHIAFAWHNKPIILGSYIAALWVDGVLLRGWTHPDEGTLEGWRTTNPTTPFSEIMRIGDSIFPYTPDEQLRGPIDNIVFYNFAKSNYADRFRERPRPSPNCRGQHKKDHYNGAMKCKNHHSYDDDPGHHH